MADNVYCNALGLVDQSCTEMCVKCLRSLKVNHDKYDNMHIDSHLIDHADYEYNIYFTKINTRVFNPFINCNYQLGIRKNIYWFSPGISNYNFSYIGYLD